MALEQFFSFSNMVKQIEWTLQLHVHDACMRVMPFPETRLEVCSNLEYLVAFTLLNELVCVNKLTGAYQISIMIVESISISIFQSESQRRTQIYLIVMDNVLIRRAALEERRQMVHGVDVTP